MKNTRASVVTGLLALGILPLFGQSINWSQIRNPHLIGGLLGARPTCDGSRSGWIYIATDATSGSNTFACIPPTWILQAGGGGGTGNVTGPGTNTNNQFALWTGTSNTLKTGPLLLGTGADIPSIGASFVTGACAVSDTDGTLSIAAGLIGGLPSACVKYNPSLTLTPGGLVKWSSVGGLSGGPFLDNGPPFTTVPSANSLPLSDSGNHISPAWIATLLSCGDSTHALGYAPGTPGFTCQAITGSAAAGGSDTQIQFNSSTALGGISKWTTNGTTTINGIATSILDLHLGASIFLPGSLSTGFVRVTTSTGAISGTELSGDGVTSGSGVLQNTKINGTTVPINSAADQTLITTASATGAWKTWLDCNGAGDAVTYAVSTHSIGCHNIAGSGTINTGTGLAFYPSSGTTLSGTGADFGFAFHIISAGAAGVLDLSSASPTAGLKLPSSAGASPTTAGVFSYDSTNKNLVWGDGTLTEHVPYISGSPPTGGVAVFQASSYALNQFPLRGSGTDIPTINGTSGVFNCVVALAGGTLSATGNTVGGIPTTCVKYDPTISPTAGGLVKWSNTGGLSGGPFLDNGPAFSQTPLVGNLVQAGFGAKIDAGWIPAVIAANTTGSAASLTGYGFSGTGTNLGTTSGSLPVGNCVRIVATGNLGDAGAPCGTSIQFGSICNNTITSTALQTSIPSGCSLSTTIIQVFLDGALLQAGSGNDYTVSGNNILMDGTSYPFGLSAGRKVRIIE